MVVPSKSFQQSFWWKTEASLSWSFCHDMTNGGRLFFLGIPINISTTTPAHSPRRCAYGSTFKKGRTIGFIGK
jgi:hypothetical protein